MGVEKPRPQSSPAKFDTKSPVKFVGRSRLGHLAINRKCKIVERSQVSNFIQKKKYGNQISFLISTIILKCSEGVYVIFSGLHSIKQVFVEQYLGFFSLSWDFFAILCQAFLLLALGSKPPPFTQIAGIGLETRQHSYKESCEGKKRKAKRSSRKSEINCTFLKYLASNILIAICSSFSIPFVFFVSRNSTVFYSPLSKRVEARGENRRALSYGIVWEARG